MFSLVKRRKTICETENKLIKSLALVRPCNKYSHFNKISFLDNDPDVDKSLDIDTEAGTSGESIALAYLKTRVDDWERVLQFWEETRKQRLHFLKSLNGNILDQYYDNFPCLLEPRSIELHINDFVKLRKVDFAGVAQINKNQLKYLLVLAKKKNLKESKEYKKLLAMAGKSIQNNGNFKD